VPGADRSELMPGDDGSEMALSADRSELVPGDDRSELMPGDDGSEMALSADRSKLVPGDEGSGPVPGDDGSELVPGTGLMRRVVAATIRAISLVIIYPVFIYRVAAPTRDGAPQDAVSPVQGTGHLS
jgi:hypothetical protein